MWDGGQKCHCKSDRMSWRRVQIDTLMSRLQTQVALVQTDCNDAHLHSTITYIGVTVRQYMCSCTTMRIWLHLLNQHLGCPWLWNQPTKNVSWTRHCITAATAWSWVLPFDTERSPSVTMCMLERVLFDENWYQHHDWCVNTDVLCWPNGWPTAIN